jgi:EmrB/QacA subfamily drug resistance transporter
VALMMASGLVAMNQTIVATAVPSVVADLGGFAEFPWLFSVYLLAQAVSTPVFGRLSDVHGRRSVMLAGIGLFLLSSVLCAVAWSMPALIVFRALQGLGAGAIQPMGATIAGDVYSLAERAKVQGYLASVWGVCSVLGPALGGVLSEYATWRWIFWINVPLGLLAVVLLRRNFHENVERRPGAFDYAGAALLGAGCSLLVLGLLEGGQAWAWTSTPSFASFTGAVLLLIAFASVERRAAAPVAPLWLFTRRLLVAANMVALAVGAIVLGLTAYVPTFAQGVLGAGPIQAGLALGALTLGWPVTAGLAGRLYLRIGFRWTGLLGSVLAVTGTVLVTVAADARSLVLLSGAALVTGLGMGLIASPTLIAAQSSVGWADRGTVTGTNMFMRSLGSALAVAVLGAVANAVLAGGPATGQALADASVTVFGCVVLVAVAMVGALALLPGGRTPVVPRPGREPVAADTGPSAPIGSLPPGLAPGSPPPSQPG